MSTDKTIRMTIFMAQMDRGATDEAAAAAMYGVHPIVSNQPPSRSLERRIRKRSRDLARRLKGTPPDRIQGVCTEAFEDYVEYAREAGDAYYTELYETMLDEYGSDR